MTIDVFEPASAEDDILLEISRKLSNVSIHKLPTPGGTVEKDTLPTVKYLLYSADPDQIRQSIRLLRRYLTQGHSDETSVNDILGLDILPRIKELLEADLGNTIKFECAWIVTNIAAGMTEQTNAVIQAGFVDVLLKSMSDTKSKLDLKAQAAWALGNIAGESPQYREELMKKGFTHSIVTVLNSIYDEAYDEATYSQYEHGKMRFAEEEDYANVEALLWALSNMSRGGFCVAEYFRHYLPMFETFSKYIVFDYPKLEIEVCWGLSRILYNMHDVHEFHKRNHISDELCERLSGLLNHGIPKVVVPAIRTVVNITSGPNENVLGLLRTPILSSITRLLEPQAPNEIRKDAYLVISNLAAGNNDMIDHVLSHKVVMLNVVAHITVPGHIYDAHSKQWNATVSHAYYYRNDEWKVTKEALWIIFNIISLGSDNSVWNLLQEHTTLPQALALVFRYIYLPLDVCEKVIECMISLIQRSNKWIDQRFPHGKNPYVRHLIDYGVPASLAFVTKEAAESSTVVDLCQKLEKLLLASEEDVVQTASISDMAGMASAFGLPTIIEIKAKSNKRRVIRGLEDGDVRLIENAVGNLCI
ncbi:Importin alpha subunit (Karyopherin alpha subunit) (Serine-rich RNA polymerase I suppressor protein) [Rhizopus stolonifer]|uniref:Importin alpha subunit (Karyopherin alpha subunit) (Serine-rich RNA polymerase I suppressor protein) n=1 Tax=Rhizopus stolonifer TaxID=4846 RepID=A0A367KLW8_RHIST|nr:Importin alpha subunit (Karyopherin alpha subunit) (Serine-rich RNA polymerase I suppressor protein) [Rhizopus stolonifer]